MILALNGFDLETTLNEFNLEMTLGDFDIQYQCQGHISWVLKGVGGVSICIIVSV